MIGGILKVLGLFDKVIDKTLVDKDLARQLKHELKTQALELSAAEMKAATSIIVAEAQGESFLQRNWRPATMIFFVIMIGGYWFGLAPDYLVNNPNVVEALFQIVQIGLGGYVAGRSAEKVTKIWKEPEVERAKNASHNAA